MSRLRTSASLSLVSRIRFLTFPSELESNLVDHVFPSIFNHVFLSYITHKSCDERFAYIFVHLIIRQIRQTRLGDITMQIPDTNIDEQKHQLLSKLKILGERYEWIHNGRPSIIMRAKTVSTYAYERQIKHLHDPTTAYCLSLCDNASFLSLPHPFKKKEEKEVWRGSPNA